MLSPATHNAARASLNEITTTGRVLGRPWAHELYRCSRRGRFARADGARTVVRILRVAIVRETSIDLIGKLDAAIAQMERVRAELGDESAAEVGA